MLEIYNSKHIKLYNTTKYKDLIIEKELNGDNIINFKFPKIEESKYLKEENYIRTKENEYVIKSTQPNVNDIEVVAIINLEELEGQYFEVFESIGKTITECINLALVNTNWRIAFCDIDKRRTIKLEKTNSYKIIKDCIKTYKCYIEFNSITKEITIKKNSGENRGTYFIESLNLLKIEVNRETYNFATRLIPIGKNGIKINQINNDKDYVENYQYSDKIITKIWEDNRYTDIEQLKEDAIIKLEELSKPNISYRANIIDLAKINKEYNILDYKLGDTIYLISKELEIKEEQKIVKIIEDVENPQNNKIEISNTQLRLEDIQEELKETEEFIKNVIDKDYSINANRIRGLKTTNIEDFKNAVNSQIDLTEVNNRIEYLSVNKASIQDLQVINAKIGTLEATTAKITDLQVINANIENLKANKADITELNSALAKIKVLEVDNAIINNLLAGNITGENIQSGGITSDKITIDNGFIKNAMIDSIEANKINTGILNTEKVVIKSQSGNLIIRDNTIQIKDNNKTRIQIGKDNQENYNMYVFNENGILLFDATNGITENGIKENIIRDDMISNDANINANKINISSVIREINNDTESIKASKIQLDGENQNLNVSFTKLEKEIKEIEIGSKNYIKNAGKFINDDFWIGNILVRDNILECRGRIKNTTKVKIEEDKYYIFSALINLPINYNVNISNILKYEIIKNEQLTTNNIFETIEVITDKEIINNKNTRIAIRLKTLKTINDDYYLNIIIDPIIDGRSYKIINVQLEQGSVISDWQINTDEKFTITEEKLNSAITDINIQQGKINTAIENTQIIKNGEIILLKDDYNRTLQTVDQINSTIGKHKTEINKNTGQINKVNVEVNEVKRNLNGITSRVEQTEITTGKLTKEIDNTKIDTEQKINTIKSEITQNKNEINSKVTELEISSNNLDNKINLQETEISQLKDKIKTTVTKNELSSSLTQTHQNITMEFSNSGNNNLIENSTGLNFSKKIWLIENGTLEVGGNQNLVTSNYYFIIENNIGNKASIYSNRFDLKANTEYTISFYINTNSSIKAAIYLLTSNSIKSENGSLKNKGFDKKQTILDETDTNNLWKKYSITFTTTNEISGYIRVDSNTTTQNISKRSHISSIMLIKGSVEKEWTPNNGEIYNAKTKIDNEGIEVIEGAMKITAIDGKIAFKVDDLGYIYNEWGVKSMVAKGKYITTNNGSTILADENCSTLLRGFGLWHESIDNRYNMRISSKNEIWFTNLADEWQDIKVRRTSANDFLTIGETTARLYENTLDALRGRLWLNWGGGTPGSLSKVFIGSGMEDGQYGDLYCNNLYTNGRVNRVIETINYGTRSLNNVEATECILEDFGTGITKNLEAIIEIDPIFKETINTNKYNVLLSAYKEGTISVIERTSDYFKVKSSVDMEFYWIIRGKQKECENKRLDIIKK